jgi:hypothetical protein
MGGSSTTYTLSIYITYTRAQFQETVPLEQKSFLIENDK